MKPQRRTPNPKRCLHRSSQNSECLDRLRNLAEQLSYGGNPEHKRNPGDFKLTPPSFPRQGKSLCDEVSVFTRRKALLLLKEGFLRGLVSEQMRGIWPQNVWSVKDGIALEAMLENPELGTYHGYPMPVDDPLADEILKRWRN